MGTTNAILRKSIVEAKSLSFLVYERAKRQPGAGRAAVFALGRYEGLKTALELLKKQMRRDVRSAPSARA